MPNHAAISAAAHGNKAAGQSCHFYGRPAPPPSQLKGRMLTGIEDACRKWREFEQNACHTGAVLSCEIAWQHQTVSCFNPTNIRPANGCRKCIFSCKSLALSGFLCSLCLVEISTSTPNSRLKLRNEIYAASCMNATAWRSQLGPQHSLASGALHLEHGLAQLQAPTPAIWSTSAAPAAQSVFRRHVSALASLRGTLLPVKPWQALPSHAHETRL